MTQQEEISRLRGIYEHVEDLLGRRASTPDVIAHIEDVRTAIEESPEKKEFLARRLLDHILIEKEERDTPDETIVDFLRTLTAGRDPELERLSREYFPEYVYFLDLERFIEDEALRHSTAGPDELSIVIDDMVEHIRGMEALPWGYIITAVQPGLVKISEGLPQKLYKGIFSYPFVRRDAPLLMLRERDPHLVELLANVLPPEVFHALYVRLVLAGNIDDLIKLFLLPLSSNWPFLDNLPAMQLKYPFNVDRIDLQIFIDELELGDVATPETLMNLDPRLVTTASRFLTAGFIDGVVAANVVLEKPETSSDYIRQQVVPTLNILALLRGTLPNEPRYNLIEAFLNPPDIYSRVFAKVFHDNPYSLVSRTAFEKFNAINPYTIRGGLLADRYAQSQKLIDDISRGSIRDIPVEQAPIIFQYPAFAQLKSYTLETIFSRDKLSGETTYNRDLLMAKTGELPYTDNMMEIVRPRLEEYLLAADAQKVDLAVWIFFMPRGIVSTTMTVINRPNAGFSKEFVERANKLWKEEYSS